MGYEIAKLAVQSFSAVYTPLKDLCLCLKKDAEYIKDLEDNLTKLTTEISTISSRKEQIDRISKTIFSKEPSDEYRILLKQIEVFKKKYAKFITKYQNACGNLQNPMTEPNISNASAVIDELQGRKPTILTRKFCTLAKLSRDISKLLDYISKVNEKLKPENMVIQSEPDPVQVKYTDYDIPVHDEYVAEVFQHFPKKGRINIGIVGTIGVGKTTVMKKLNNKLEDFSSLPSCLRFDIVIWVTYPTKLETEEQVIKMIQDVIMTRLQINHEKTDSIQQNASIISKALHHKRYVLLLDQVSTTIDLHMIGILGKHPVGKVVLASRSPLVINEMTDLTVKIQKLSYDEALHLFQKICGTEIVGSIKCIAEGIINSCGGLPLVIMLVATYLKDKKEESLWSDAKRMLQSDVTSIKLLGLAGVCNAYKMVYDELPLDYLKSCSLYGALFPIEHEVCKEYLIECWIAEHFIDVPGNQKLRFNQDRGMTVLNILTSRFLLERCSDKYVKMPLFFRNVALQEKFPREKDGIIWAASKDELPNSEVWKKATRMSLIQSEAKLPESPESSNISTLLLQKNPKLVTLADLFFSHMKNLRVLDLHRTGIRWLPKSISELLNLRNLYLNDCSNLLTLPSEVKDLKNLELLDICRTSIPWLPLEIKSMGSLRCLRASFVQKDGCSLQRNEVEGISPYDIISHLEQLEELSIEADVSSQSWFTVAHQIADELSGLEKLTTLCFNFPSVNTLQKFVSSSKSWKNESTHWGKNTFRSFKIFIGVHGAGHPDINGAFAERYLRFSTNEEISSVKEVLKQASAFELIGHDNVETLSEFDLKNLGSLKVCVVKRCNSLLNIVDASKTEEMSTSIVEESDNSVLPSLVRLHLLDLNELKCIWKGKIFTKSLSNLTVLTLCDCPKLKEVLPPELAKIFSNLKYLKVAKCSEIMNIIGGGQSNLSDILHKLESIELETLPKLVSICVSTTVNWVLLKKIVIIECRNLRSLPFSQDNAKRLSLIECEESWWDELQLEEHFHGHCKFTHPNESSTNGENPKAETLSNINSPTYNGHRRLESLTTSSRQTIDMDNQTEMHKGKAGLGTSESPNIDAPAKNENFLPSKTRFGQSGSSDIPSSEMYALADGVQILDEVASSSHLPVILQSSSIVQAAASN